MANLLTGSNIPYFCYMEQAEDWIQEEIAEDIYERRTFVADKGQEPMRIDKWIQMRFENATRSKVQKSIENGFVTVNGKLIKSNYKIKAGDEVITMLVHNPDASEVKPEPIPLDIRFEDEHLMVVHKPANMVVHPGVGNYTGTLLNGIAYHLLQQMPDLDEEALPRFGLVHRIDKNTTGLLVVAKTPAAAAGLVKQFAAHTVQRKYVALVWGNLEEDEGTINAHIARHRQFRKMFDAYPDGEIGKHAITHYRVLERFHYVTLVECVLETGRTHQIRVHMKHIGHTLFHDSEYGGDKILKGTIYSKYKQFVENCFTLCPRCALHAATLGFVHPITQQEISFESELPSDMNSLIEKWRNYTRNIQVE